MTPWKMHSFNSQLCPEFFLGPMTTSGLLTAMGSPWRPLFCFKLVMLPFLLSRWHRKPSKSSERVSNEKQSAHVGFLFKPPASVMFRPEEWKQGHWHLTPCIPSPSLWILLLCPQEMLAYYSRFFHALSSKLWSIFQALIHSKCTNFSYFSPNSGF